MQLLLFILCLITVSVGCLIPAKYLPPLPNDKVLHFTAFACLSLLAASLAESFWQHVAAYLGLLFAGYLLECAQNWVPGRSFCWRDMFANAAGIASAAILVLIVQFLLNHT